MSYPEQVVSVIVPEHLEPIYTPRLLLRPLRIDNDEDAAGIFTFRSRQDVVDWFWPRVADTTTEATKTWMRRNVFNSADASGAVGRLFTFVIIPKDGPGRIIGDIGVNSLTPAPSLGYTIHPLFWGKGYASEAAQAVIDAWWKLPRAVGMGQDEKLYAAVNYANKGSLKVLQRNGFQVYQDVQFGEETVAFMSLKQPKAAKTT